MRKPLNQAAGFRDVNYFVRWPFAPTTPQQSNTRFNPLEHLLVLTNSLLAPPSLSRRRARPRWGCSACCSLRRRRSSSAP
eukprot:6184790-Pleurochrysis_carterae.AAC.3